MHPPPFFISTHWLHTSWRWEPALCHSNSFQSALNGIYFYEAFHLGEEISCPDPSPENLLAFSEPWAHQHLQDVVCSSKPHRLCTNPSTHSLMLFPIIQGTHVFRIDGFKYTLALNSVAFLTSLGRESDSTIPCTRIYPPWCAPQKGFLKAPERHIINPLCLLSYGFVFYSEIRQFCFIFVFP